MPVRFGLLWVALLAVPELAGAQVRPVVHQRLVGIVAPEGVEHSISLGARARLGDPDELLFTGAHVEAGVINYTSPIYTVTGGYLQVSPLAFLVLRAEASGTAMWAIGMPGAGYFPVDGYAADLSGENLNAGRGELATGWNVRLSSILQGAVPIGATRLLMWNETAFEHLTLGDAGYYYTPRYDLVLARQDWILGNHSMLLLDVPLDPGLSLRVGAYDQLTYVLRSGLLQNQAGGVVSLVIDHPVDGIAEIMPYVRAGVHTNNERREGDFTFLAMVMVRYEP